VGEQDQGAKGLCGWQGWRWVQSKASCTVSMDGAC